MNIQLSRAVFIVPFSATMAQIGDCSRATLPRVANNADTQILDLLALYHNLTQMPACQRDRVKSATRDAMFNDMNARLVMYICSVRSKPKASRGRSI